MSVKQRGGRRATLFALIVLAGLSGGAVAEPFEVRASIQPDHGITDTQPIQLLIQIEGDTSPRVQQPRLGELSNLRVMGGPNTNTRMSWINGRSTATVTLSYTLLAKEPGPAEIPSIEVQVDSRVHRTQPIRFTVERGATKAPPPAPRPDSSGSQPDDADLFIETALGADEVWLGQPVTLSLLVYNPGYQISGMGLADGPKFGDFWVEDVEVDTEAEQYRTSVGQRLYATYPVLRKVLVPQTAGEFEIDPYVLQLRVRSRGGFDPFDLFSRSQTVVRKSAPVTLRVKPLPAAGRPAAFSGAVGSFTMQVSVDRDEIRVNDAVALRATVEGEGFLKLASPPAFDPPPDLKVLDPKVSESFRTTGGRMVSKKSWEWILVPLAQGEVRLPDLLFEYFDSGAGEYRTAKRQLPRLAVRRGDGPAETSTARGEIQLQRRDIAFIKPLRGPLRERSSRRHDRALFVTLLALPLAWVPLVILVGRRQARLQQDRGLARARKARARARKRLRAVGRRVEQLDASTFHEEVGRALVDYVADRFNRAASGLTYELADELLASRGAEPELRRRYRTCLESCDFARFVPAAGKKERRTELLDEASELLDALERAC